MPPKINLRSKARRSRDPSPEDSKATSKRARTSGSPRTTITQAAWRAYDGETWGTMSIPMLLACARHYGELAGTRDMKKVDLIAHCEGLEDTPPSVDQLRKWIVEQAKDDSNNDESSDDEEDSNEDPDGDGDGDGDGDDDEKEGKTERAAGSAASSGLLKAAKGTGKATGKATDNGKKTKTSGTLDSDLDRSALLYEWATAHEQDILEKINEEKKAAAAAAAAAGAGSTAPIGLQCECAVPAASRFCAECGGIGTGARVKPPLQIHLKPSTAPAAAGAGAGAAAGAAAGAGGPAPTTDEKKEQAWESAPFASHLSKSTRDDIKRGSYIDLKSLLHPALLGERKEERVRVSDNLYFEDGSKTNSGARINDFEGWTEAYIVYTKILTAMRPDRLADLIGYSHNINQCSRDYGFATAKRYDALLRSSRTGHAARWEPNDTGLMTRAHLLESRSARAGGNSGAGGSGSGDGGSAGGGRRTGSRGGSSSSGSTSGSGRNGDTRAPASSGEACRNWNTKRCNRGSSCAHKHECLRCGDKEHRISECKKPARASSPSRSK